MLDFLIDIPLWRSLDTLGAGKGSLLLKPIQSWKFVWKAKFNLYQRIKLLHFIKKTFLAVEFRKSKIFAFWFGLKAYFVISVFIPGIFCDQYKPFYTLYQPWPVKLGGSALTYLSCRLLDFWKKLFMLIVQNCFRRHNYNDYFFLLIS